MPVTEKKISINKTARITGLLYLTLLPLGILGILYIPANLIVPEDATATVGNIMANEMLFRFSIVAALLIPLINMAVVLLLYRLLKPVNKIHALLMVLLILLPAPIAMINELNQLAILLLLRPEYLTMFTADQLPTMVSLLFDLHDGGIAIAQIFWGLWLFPMGWLIFKSGFLPKFLGILMMIGCLGYVIDSFTFLLFPDFGVTVTQFTFVGELLLPLWLLIKGVNVDQWEKRALETA
jgi:hypothetical protein